MKKMRVEEDNACAPDIHSGSNQRVVANLLPCLTHLRRIVDVVDNKNTLRIRLARQIFKVSQCGFSGMVGIYVGDVDFLSRVII